MAKLFRRAEQQIAPPIDSLNAKYQPAPITKRVERGVTYHVVNAGSEILSAVERQGSKMVQIKRFSTLVPRN